jgi:mycofactocin system transcriptional regulator
VTASATRIGRPRVTSRRDVERVAIRLFTARGYDATTVDDIAAAAGISRRTFFRYFASKNDVVWGDFHAGLAGLRARLDATPASTPTAEALRHAIVAFNALPAEQVALHRERMRLIFTVSSLQAHSTLMYAEWRTVIATFVAGRTGDAPTDLAPRLAGHVLLAAAVAAYEQWLEEPDAELTVLLDASVGRAAHVVGHRR